MTLALGVRDTVQNTVLRANPILSETQPHTKCHA